MAKSILNGEGPKRWLLVMLLLMFCLFFGNVGLAPIGPKRTLLQLLHVYESWSCGREAALSWSCGREAVLQEINFSHYFTASWIWKPMVSTSKVFLFIIPLLSFHLGHEHSLSFCPPCIRKQLLLHPQSDDSDELSQMETKKLLGQLVEAEMNKCLKESTYKGNKFNAIYHFFGYQAGGALPSKFDCDYAYVLGHVCYHIISGGLNGYMATVTYPKSPVNKCRCGSAPISSMMTVKRWSRGPSATQIGKPAVHMASVHFMKLNSPSLHEVPPTILNNFMPRTMIRGSCHRTI